MAHEEDLKTFIREQTMRLERAVQAMERSLREMGDRLESNTDQVRANTEATWRMLDRFNDGPGQA